MAVTDETLRAAIILYLKRSPMSSWETGSKIAKVLLPQEYEEDAIKTRERILDILNREKDGVFEYHSHLGWILLTKSDYLRRLIEMHRHVEIRLRYAAVASGRGDPVKLICEALISAETILQELITGLRHVTAWKDPWNA